MKEVLMSILQVPSFGDYRYNRRLLEKYTQEAFAVMLPTDAYIIESQGKAALVNAPGNTGIILDILRQHELVLTHILLTNGHFEHIYALNEIVKKTDAAVYIHKNDCSKLEEYAADIKKLLEIELPPVYSGEMHPLEEGDVIELGQSKITVLHTPGVTEGSVCYKTGGSLFSGDLIGRQSVGSPGLPGGNSGQLLKSLERLRDSKEELTIYPSHWGITSIGRERDTNLATLPRVRVGVMVSLTG
jgi:glyoxylase-like metal-dependent hydrolase (beta-lactamase superfamily II)